MFTEPQTVTISGTGYSCARTGVGLTDGVLSTADGVGKFSISHRAVGKSRWRRAVRFDFKKIAADPITAVNQEYTFSVYLTVNTPSSGFTVAEQKAVIDGFLANLQASTGANITKMLGAEI